ncbi:MAG TPA: sterol desaturase family protein [Allosphingosinicella sp.]|nr:sterol desaturase family protein [Allosphingosinicella sp.]
MIEQYLMLLGPVLVLALLFRAVEWLAPAESGQPLGAWLFNLFYMPFFLAFALLAGSAFGPAFSFAHAQTGGGLLPAFAGEGSGPGALLLFAFVYALMWDLCQYALHRLQHGIPFLWETHKFHHDETALNAAAQTRVHPTSYVLATMAHIPVIILLGPQTPHFLAAFVLFSLWGFVNHANVRLDLGPLTPLISGPQWHRIHHSILPEHRDRNFAAFFPVIDLAFGTYYRPLAGEYPPSGLDAERVPSLRGATIEPFRAWLAMIGRRREAPGTPFSSGHSPESRTPRSAP